jgi:hypothetical protein
MIECRIYDKIEKNKIKALWGVMPCSLLDRYQHFKGICIFPCRRRQQVLFNPWYLFTRSLGVTFQPTVMLTTSIIISSRNFKIEDSLLNLVLSHVIKRFAANKSVQNLNIKNTVKFVTKNSSHSTLHTGYTGVLISP